MQLIKQRTLHDCAICTIAMALGKTYEEVLAKALSNEHAYDAATGCKEEWWIIEQFGLKQETHFIQRHRNILDPQFFLWMSWGRRAILTVPSLNTPGRLHSVYEEWYQLRPNDMILFNEMQTAWAHR